MASNSSAGHNGAEAGARELRLLYLEDSPIDIDLVRETLRSANFDLRMTATNNGRDFAALIGSNSYDIILSDYELPGFDAPAALELVGRVCPDTPFMCISGAIGEEKAVELLKLGCRDYLPKSRIEKLPVAIQRILNEAESQRAQLAAEAALAESEKLYRALFENMMNAFAYCSVVRENGVPVDLIVLSVNGAFVAQTGLQDPVGKRASELVPGVRKLDPKVFDMAMQVVASGEPVHDELFVTSMQMWIALSMYCPAPDRLAIVFDVITERKRAEEALRASEEKFAAIANYSNSWEGWFDPNGRLVWVNDYGLGLTGYTNEELLQAPDFIGMIVAPEDLGMMRGRFLSGMLGGRGDDVEYRCVRKDGTTFWVSVSWRPILDSNGRSMGIRTSARDITQRRQMEEELRAARDRAEVADKLKDAFIANISHEIRTPLNIILGYSDFIEEKFMPLVDESELEWFESVRRGGERLTRTVGMILNMSRLQTGDFPLRPAHLDVCRILENIVKDHQPMAMRKNIALTLSTECDTADITADEYCITQAVSNLVNNAIKFTMDGGVDLRVFRDPADRVCISCTDTGIGISKEYLPVLFSRYSQEQFGYTRSFEGLGLGMALVKEYLALNNATVEVASEKGKGSTFTITFQREGSAV